MSTFLRLSMVNVHIQCPHPSVCRYGKCAHPTSTFLWLRMVKADPMSTFLWLRMVKADPMSDKVSTLHNLPSRSSVTSSKPGDQSLHLADSLCSDWFPCSRLGVQAASCWSSTARVISLSATVSQQSPVCKTNSQSMKPHCKECQAADILLPVTQRSPPGGQLQQSKHVHDIHRI